MVKLVVIERRQWSFWNLLPGPSFENEHSVHSHKRAGWGNENLSLP